MDARKNPRTKTSFKAALTSLVNGVEQTRVIEDISQSGFFVSSLSNPKIDDLFQITIKRPGQSNTLKLIARICRVSDQGCGLSFDHIQQHESQFLTELTNPMWDGKDILEGVIMYGILENTTDFASCMRLTSLLSSSYRHAGRVSSQSRAFQ